MTRTQFLRLFSIAGAFLVGFWLPIRLVGFEPPFTLELTFDLIISAISVMNIWLHFEAEGRSLRDSKSWISLSLSFSGLCDLICALPLSLIAFEFFPTAVSAILCLNILAVRHVRQIKPFLDEFDSLRPMTYRLTPLFIALPLIVHFAACVWIKLGSGSAGTNADATLTYVKAMYWAFSTLTTVGYGDITAVTIPQMIYSCAIQVCGVGVFGYILSNVAGLIARSDAAREHHMDNLDKIETFMKLHRTPIELRSKIRSYYHYMWINKKGYQDEALIEGLPAKIQSELFLHINRPIVERVPFLRDASDEMIGDLMNELHPRIFVPGERVFKFGETGDALYFIQSGNVEVLSQGGDLIATLGQGAFFGEMALVTQGVRSATTRASQYCDVFVLHRDAFERVTAKYPEFRDHLHDVIKQRSA